MLAEALKRTLLLMRSDFETVSDEELLDALTGTSVVLSAGLDVVQTHSGQSAIVAAATLMLRTGHGVFLDFPDALLLGAQPPLRSGGGLLGALLECGADLLPGRDFKLGRPAAAADLAIAFGNAAPAPAELALALDATDWAARLSRGGNRSPWSGGDWPIGGLACGALAAGEAFKTAMRTLKPRAATPLFDDWYEACTEATVELAPRGAMQTPDLGTFDVISGGAIANGALFALLRLPEVTGSCRVLDDDASALSNLNRNALLRRSRLALMKVEDLASYANGLAIGGLAVRFEETFSDVHLADTVLVGVDHIPSRWAVQRTGPAWLGVGATDRFTVQVSRHRSADPCAGCAYPYGNDPGGDIPTVAFVSFWSGLLLAVELLGRPSVEVSGTIGQRLFCALRPESFAASRLPLALHPECPLGCGARKAA
jgi:hypothetical protein